MSFKGDECGGLDNIEDPRQLLLASCCRYRRGGDACVEKRAHDCLALIFGQVRCHHRLFDCLHDGTKELVQFGTNGDMMYVGS